MFSPKAEQLSELLSVPGNLEKLIKEKVITVTEAQLLVNTFERERCKSDLFYLTTKVLGYSELSLNPEIYQSLCAVVQSINPIVKHQFELFAAKHNIDLINNQVLTTHQVRDRIFMQKKEPTVGVGRGGRNRLDPTQNSIKFLQNLIEPPIVYTNDKETPASARNISAKFGKFMQFDESARTRLFLMFRGSFKTTIISIAHTIQLMLINPNVRILIASHKKEGGSQEILGAIKQHFMQNTRFRNLFPEYCPRPNQMGTIEWGTTERVTLPNRSQFAIYPEETIEISGMTTDNTGRHYDVIKGDDLVTKDSVTNETMLEKTENYNSLLKFLFNQPEWGILDYVGTPYHFADLYASLREQEGITKVIIPILDKDGNSTFPQRFTEEGINKIKSDPSMTSYVFSCQYLLNPVPVEDQIFRPEWWKTRGFFYEPDQLPINLSYYVFVDPANKQKKKSDYTCLCVAGLDANYEWWVIDLIRDKLDVDGRANLVIESCMKRKLHKVFYESVGFQNTDISIIKNYCKAKQYYIEVEEMKFTSQSKEDRIRALQPKFQHTTIHFPKSYPYYSKYENRTIDMIPIFNKEAWMFPKTDHDDMLDCLSNICKVDEHKPKNKIVVQEDDEFERVRKFDIQAKKSLARSNKKFTGSKHNGSNSIPFTRYWR